MTLAALGQADAERARTMARTLGYGPVAAWLKAVFPRVYPQIRLPVYAVIAYAVSRSEEHTSELQSLMRISYAVFCLKKKKTIHTQAETSQKTEHNTKMQ